MAASTSSIFEANGFSQMTCFLWLRKSRVCGKCRAFGLAIWTASMASLCAISSSEVNRCSNQIIVREGLRLFKAAGIDGGELKFAGFVGGVDELARDPVRTNDCRNVS